MLSDQKGFPMRKLGTALLSLWGMLLILATAPAQAQLSTNLEINYYTIGQGDQDFGHLAGGHFSNEVMTTLGPNGLPVLNTAQYGCISSLLTSPPSHQPRSRMAPQPR